MTKVIVAFLISVFLVGCSGTRGNTIEVTNQVSYVSVPADKLVPVLVPTPPDKELYLKLKPVEKEKALAEYASKLLVALSMANGVIEDIKTWNNNLLKKNKD